MDRVASRSACVDKGEGVWAFKIGGDQQMIASLDGLRLRRGSGVPAAMRSDFLACTSSTWRSRNDRGWS
jgi:hypothetical protein